MKKLNILRVTTRMEELGLIQANLAESLNLSRESISQWMKGTKTPRLRHLNKLATLLDLPCEELVLKEKLALGSFANKDKPLPIAHPTSQEVDTLSMEYLHSLFVTYPKPCTFSLPHLQNPSTDYTAVHAVASHLRKSMALGPCEAVTAHHLINYLRTFPIVFIPVLWGKKGDIAQVVHLQQRQMFCIYVHLEARLSDVTVWLLQELGYILTPTLPARQAFQFSRAFAGAMVFPQACSEEVASLANDGLKVARILKEAAERQAPPLTIYQEVQRYLHHQGRPLLDFTITGTSAHILSMNTLLRDLLFTRLLPPAQQYIEKSTAFFGPEFWDALTQFLLHGGHSPKEVQDILGIPLAEAQEIWSYLT